MQAFFLSFEIRRNLVVTFKKFIFLYKNMNFLTLVFGLFFIFFINEWFSFSEELFLFLSFTLFFLSLFKLLGKSLNDFLVKNIADLKNQTLLYYEAQGYIFESIVKMLLHFSSIWQIFQSLNKQFKVKQRLLIKSILISTYYFKVLLFLSGRYNYLMDLAAQNLFYNRNDLRSFYYYALCVRSSRRLNICHYTYFWQTVLFLNDFVNCFLFNLSCSQIFIVSNYNQVLQRYFRNNLVPLYRLIKD